MPHGGIVRVVCEKTSVPPREAIPRTFKRFSLNLKQHKHRTVHGEGAKSFIKVEIETARVRASPFGPGNMGTRRMNPLPHSHAQL